MTRQRIHSRLGCLALLTTVIALAIPAMAGAQTKTYTFDIAPDTSSAGPDVTFTTIIRNTASGPQSLGSANITAPEGFEVLGASSSRGITSVAGRTVQLRDLALSPGGSVTTTVRVDDTAVTGVWDWRTAVKQANDFAGVGNDFALNPLLPSDFDTEITPDTATRGAGGSSVDCPEEDPDPDATPCRLKITHRGVFAGSFYTASLAVTAFPALPANAGTLLLELPTTQNLDCLTLTERSPVTGRAEGPLNRRKVVTFTIAGVPGLGSDVPPGLCYASNIPFVSTGPGLPFLFENTPFFTGTLPDCAVAGGASLSGVTPCVLSRRNEGGTWILQADIPASVPDPLYRG